MISKNKYIIHKKNEIYLFYIYIFCLKAIKLLILFKIYEE